MPHPEYSRLFPPPHASESDDVELLAPEDNGWPSELTSLTTRTNPPWLSEATAWKALTLSLVLSLVISTVNLTFLSGWATVFSHDGDSTTPRPLEYPSVYIGLESVAHDPSQCLNRGTFPDSFYTYDARKGARAKLDRVYAPDDEITLTFGGPIRTVMETRVLDYGLQNCTFVIHSNTARLGQGQGVDVYLFPTEKPGEGPTRDAEFLDRVYFVPGKDSESRPFFCPSRSRIRFELRCPDDDCIVHVPLQGVTTRTSTSGSVVKTGFRMNQYEAVDCISESRGN
ncbi:hypothetical protein GSI_14641 [Ganoderma sinense ZZ0214-1]|uniref:Ubiquitin 3 binding protein But2 C-terminal domain-containing protein n=1 Tax=Ganoderma sinense ZZ0214-1 TaxID=1077348 RepID=A0A2G8RP90_9APHY|nr:hypothetical protein GSI_14641 [Ganoderma sinense ZZ0214-1]